MSLAKVLEHFDLIAEAPDGIARLRELVLQLAVRGMLVPQDPKDEPLQIPIQDGPFQSEESEAPQGIGSSSSEESFSSDPLGWVRASLRDAGTWANGSGFPKKFQGRTNLPHMFCKVGDMNRPGNETYIVTTEHYVDEEMLDIINARLHPPGTVIFPKIGGAIATNKRRVLCKPSAIDNNCMGISPNEYIHSQYLLIILKSIDLAAYQGGTSVPALTLGRIAKIPILLPPLAEQARIVARLEELMALLDRLEASRQEREAARLAARDSALAALREATSPDNFSATWARIDERVADLFVCPEDVPPLRQAIRLLAIRGRLVPQDPSDEPATELLKQASQEQVPRLKNGKARMSKSTIRGSKADDAPFELPSGWTWTRLGEIGDWGSGSTPLRSQPKYFGGCHNWYKSGELNDMFLDGPSEERITDAALQNCSLRMNQPGDILLAMYGATVGKLAILRVAGTTNQAVCACTCSSAVFNEYLFLFLRASREFFVSSSAGAAQPNFSKDKIVTTAFPLPPLPEQHRIVVRVKGLHALCDRLESRLTSAREAQAALAAALLHEVERGDSAA